MPLFDSSAITDAAIADYHKNFKPRFAVGDTVVSTTAHGLWVAEFCYPNGFVLCRNLDSGKTWPFDPESLSKVESGKAQVQFDVLEAWGPGQGTPHLGRMEASLRLQTGKVYDQEQLCSLVLTENYQQIQDRFGRDFSVVDVRPVGDHSEKPGTICLDASPAAA